MSMEGPPCRVLVLVLPSSWFCLEQEKERDALLLDGDNVGLLQGMKVRVRVRLRAKDRVRVRG